MKWPADAVTIWRAHKPNHMVSAELLWILHTSEHIYQLQKRKRLPKMQPTHKLSTWNYPHKQPEYEKHGKQNTSINLLNEAAHSHSPSESVSRIWALSLCCTPIQTQDPDTMSLRLHIRAARAIHNHSKKVFLRPFLELPQTEWPVDLGRHQSRQRWRWTKLQQQLQFWILFFLSLSLPGTM